MTGSDSYQKFTVLDEEIEVYLRITKVDEETGKPVLLPDTAFQIYWLDEQGHYRYDSNGNPKLVTMTDTVNGHLTKDVDTFYTNSEGILTLPEKLPLGKYRIVEVTGPNGFYNEWLDSAGYENGILADDADGIYYVDFEITTDRIYAATGDKNENGMDTLVIGENYSNHETLGKLTIRKTGEVLAGWKTEVGALDPWMTGEAEDGNFVYETRPLASAEYTITAAEDIYTQDRQTDNYGNRTLWYAKGDVVAVVTTGDGSADIAAFAPARTKATYDFLSVIHDGTMDELLAYKENAEVQIQQLARQRKVLYRQKREPERAAREEKIKSLTQQMKALRHEVYICSDIETDAAEVQEKLRQAELAAQEERNEVKQDEQRRRSSRSDGAGSLTGYRGGY